LRKAERKPTKNHPVISRLLKYRQLLDKLIIVDEQFDEQVEQLTEKQSNVRSESSEIDPQISVDDGMALTDFEQFQMNENPKNQKHGKKRKIEFDESPRPKKKNKNFSMIMRYLMKILRIQMMSITVKLKKKLKIREILKSRLKKSTKKLYVEVLK